MGTGEVARAPCSSAPAPAGRAHGPAVSCGENRDPPEFKAKPSPSQAGPRWALTATLPGSPSPRRLREDSSAVESRSAARGLELRLLGAPATFTTEKPGGAFGPISSPGGRPAPRRTPSVPRPSVCVYCTRRPRPASVLNRRRLRAEVWGAARALGEAGVGGRRNGPASPRVQAGGAPVRRKTRAATATPPSEPPR